MVQEDSKKKHKICNPAEYRRFQTFSVCINILSRSDTKCNNKNIYKISVIDDLNHGRFIVYSFEKNKTSIGMFVDYVLSQLKFRNLLSKDFSINSSMDYFDLQETGYALEKSINKKRNQVQNQPLEHKDIIKSIYKELVAGSDRLSFTEEQTGITPILPPVFIDPFIKDIDKIANFTDFWQKYSIS